MAWIDAVLEGDSQVHKKQRHTRAGFLSGCATSKGLLAVRRSYAATLRESLSGCKRIWRHS
jgi:hypothetical protein